MFKKTFLSLSCALALGAVAAPALASSKFFLVVPLNAQAQAQEPVESITVSLAGAALPKATVNQAYSESLRPYLSVTGDAAFDPAAASWSLAEGTLPAGLALDETTGAVAGKPTTKTTSPASFTVLATYKGSDGQAVYTIEVGGDVLHVSSISASSNHTCAITVEGGVKCWGNNGNGQLGNDSTTNSLQPVQVAGLTSGVTSLSSGNSHTCAVISGNVKCWGANESGQLGDGSATTKLIPTLVIGGLSAVTKVDAGGSSTCAINAGALKCWGLNDQGQLGNGLSSNSSAPTQVTGLTSGIADVSVGAMHACAVTTNGGALKCWGFNAYGQLGDGTTTKSNTPQAVFGMASGVSSVSTGYWHTCAVIYGSARCWGIGVYGMLGNGSTASNSKPVPVTGLTSGVTNLTLGNWHSCAVIVGGSVKCWGYNNHGQLGNASTANSSTPVQVIGLTSGIAALAAGDSHTCAGTTTGGLKCWGYNGYGQFGNNATSSSTQPVDVQGLQ